MFKGETIPLINEEILAEYRAVLARKKFCFPSELVDIILTRLAACSQNISAFPEDYPEVADPKDRCFYAVTMSVRQSEDALLVTGNIRHFPVKPYIVTPERFVEILQVDKR